MNNRFVFLAFLLTATLLPLSLNAGNGGSGYSRYGIGDLVYFPSSRAEGMGGTAIGILSTTSINRLNPAAWTLLSRTRFSVGALYEGYSTTDGNRSAFYSGTTFNGFMITLPLKPSDGIVLGFGITPYSRVNYNVITPASFDSLSYEIQYLGEGGISQAHLGLSGIAGKDLHLGLKLNYYSGTLNYTTKQSFSGSGYTDAEGLRTIDTRGFGISVGAIFSGLKTILPIPETHTFTVGALFSASSSMDANENKYYTFNTSTITSRDTASVKDGKISLPFAIGTGLSYATERMVFASDFYFQNWDNNSFFGSKTTDLRDSYRISAGTEFLPKRDPSVPFLQRVAYRLGFFYHSSYYELKNEPLNEIGFSGGAGIPIFGDSRLNISAEYSLRGSTDLGLQKDNILRISFTLSGGELWFERPEQE